jgi:hypothetical protein
MKDLPFWFPNKKNVSWYFLFIVLFLFSLDFWAWGQFKPLILGLPLWVYYLIFLTLFLSLSFYVFTKYHWGEDK